jgi:bifunctional DNase/RNase
MTHDLVTSMLAELEARVTRITVTELRDNTFYASITIQQDGSEIEVDSRPSDAIALAVRAEAPIFADDRVVEESAIEFEGEEVNEEEIGTSSASSRPRHPDEFAVEEEETSRPAVRDLPFAEVEDR